jgi:orotidine-5'-phosphate decarboxylase
MATDRLIVALDVDTREQALTLVRQLKTEISFFKVGSQLFTREGPSLIAALREEGVDVFLDLKFHDIPQTVAKSVAAARDLSVRFLTLHVSGGREMIQAALEAAAHTSTIVLGVTILTSLDDEAVREIGFDHSASGQVLHLARLGVAAGLGGLVCSPLEIEQIRRQIKSPLTLVTPGIRTGDEAKGDQARTLSAAEAIQKGASHLVIGRPITQAPDPVAAAQAILATL